ncbi:MAG: hypothetical protein HZB86_08055 [Deltaproteobacteria bacterium]|nr:hypothetical protein [Deltaproteobacteria bacterium]
MKRERVRYGCILAAVALCLLAGVAAAAPPKGPQGAKKNGNGADHPQFAVPKPPFTPGIFPCSECHKEMKPNPTRREMKDEHTGIVLNHAQGQRWCLDCHDIANRDRLRLASGERISFDESYRLCGQCHGDKFRDWRAGVHGKRTGMWNGEKQYLLCVHCHDPHDPRYKPIAPMPPPVRPEAIK